MKSLVSSPDPKVLFCSAFLKNKIPILWGLVRFDGLSQEVLPRLSLVD